ncbi:MAG: nucleoside deaminase [Acidobacteriaceae bacterium]
MSVNVSFMELALRLATENVLNGAGGPFGAVVVKNGEIIATGVNTVTASNDPTAHAEVTAIRNACKQLNSFQLDGCEIYTSCEPCPMCLGAIYWARPAAVYYANTHADAADAGFDDSFIYAELPLPPEQRRLPMTHLELANADECFQQWKQSQARIAY